MGKKIKKGTKGEQTKFLTRAAAIRRLDIPIKDFRKLCILKGVHPREPRNKRTNNHTTYYHVKDVRYLETDKTIDYFKALKVYKRKLHRAKVKQDKTEIRHLKENKPMMDIKHIIRERYSEFDDALKDLEDPLSLLSLISKFPGHRLFKINPVDLDIINSLLLMFKSFVMN